MRRLCVFLPSLFLLSLPITVLAQVPPAADTYVASSTPNNNFGGNAILSIQNNVYTFLKFNLSGIPANATIQKAVLRVYVSAVSGSGTLSFDVYEMDSAWSESTLTWANKPPLGASATGGNPVTLNLSSKSQFVIVDITNLVQDWVTGHVQNNGIALAPTTAGSLAVSLDSKEASGTSHQAELEIAIPGATGSQGPVGPSGPEGPQGPQGIPGNLNPGSPFYVQNGTATQTGASFAVDGTGTVGGQIQAGTVNAMNTDSNQAYSVAGTAVFGIGTPADQNVFLGSGAGVSNVAGSGIANLFAGYQAGNTNATGTHNIFAGYKAGYNNKGAFNSFVGNLAGFNSTSGKSNIYLGSQGCTYPCTESNTIRIGTDGQGDGQQNTTYIAGISGASTAGGVPVFIDASGKLGTDGGNQAGVGSFNGRTGVVISQAGDYTAAQVTGALQSVNNLADLNSPAAARAVLGVPSAGTLSANALVKANGVSSIGNSTISDDGTTVTIANSGGLAVSGGPISVGTSAPLAILGTGAAAVTGAWAAPSGNNHFVATNGQGGLRVSSTCITGMAPGSSSSESCVPTSYGSAFTMSQGGKLDTSSGQIAALFGNPSCGYLKGDGTCSSVSAGAGGSSGQIQINSGGTLAGIGYGAAAKCYPYEGSGGSGCDVPSSGAGGVQGQIQYNNGGLLAGIDYGVQTKCYTFQGFNGIGCDVPSGTGNVSSNGTPTAHQTPVWVDSGSIKGVGPGSTGQVWTSNGANADPSWQTPTGGGGGVGATLSSGLFGWNGTSSIPVSGAANVVAYAHFNHPANLGNVEFSFIGTVLANGDASNNAAVALWDITANSMLCHSLGGLPNPGYANHDWACNEGAVTLIGGHDYVFLKASAGTTAQFVSSGAGIVQTQATGISPSNCSFNASNGITCSTNFTLGGWRTAVNGAAVRFILHN